MKKTNGIMAIIAGIISTFYFLLQTGKIVIRSMVKNNRYTDEFRNMMVVFGIILVVIFIIVIIYNFKYMKICSNKVNTACLVSVLLCALNSVTIVLMGMVTIFVPFIIVAGICILALE